jgi:hypothetical protein
MSMLSSIRSNDETDYFKAAPRKYGQMMMPSTALQKGSPTKPIVKSQPMNQITPPIVPVFVDP